MKCDAIWYFVLSSKNSRHFRIYEETFSLWILCGNFLRRDFLWYKVGILFNKNSSLQPTSDRTNISCICFWHASGSSNLWYGKTRGKSYELRVTSYELRVKILKVRVQIQKREFKSTSSEFKFTSYEFKSTSSRIIKSMKTQVSNFLKQPRKTHFSRS